MLPIYDRNRATKTPFVTWALIIVNVAVFLYEVQSGKTQVIQTYGFVPFLLLSNAEQHRAITSMFLHDGILHLGGNMLFLYIFGDNVESRFGHTKFLLAYLVMGVVASVAHTLWVVYRDPEALSMLAVGASGAISGVLGAYALLYPQARIVTLLFLRFYVDIVEIPAYLYLGFWFLYQLLLGWLALGGGVAYWAHTGGFAVGALLGLVARLR